MFKITCKVLDTKLAKVLRLLDGQAYDIESVPASVAALPVVETRTKGGKYKPRAGTADDVLVALPKLSQPFSIQSAIETTGISRSTVVKAIKRGVAGGRITKVAFGRYHLTKRNGAAKAEHHETL